MLTSEVVGWAGMTLALSGWLLWRLMRMQTAYAMRTSHSQFRRRARVADALCAASVSCWVGAGQLAFVAIGVFIGESP